MANCRGCDAPMRWGRNVDTGKGVPLDPEPVPDGNLVVVEDEQRSPKGEINVRYLRKDEQLPPGTDRYVSHFSTCPDADSFRTKR